MKAQDSPVGVTWELVGDADAKDGARLIVDVNAPLRPFGASLSRRPTPAPSVPSTAASVDDTHER